MCKHSCEISHSEFWGEGEGDGLRRSHLLTYTHSLPPSHRLPSFTPPPLLCFFSPRLTQLAFQAFLSILPRRPGPLLHPLLHLVVVGYRHLSINQLTDRSASHPPLLTTFPTISHPPTPYTHLFPSFIHLPYGGSTGSGLGFRSLPIHRSLRPHGFLVVVVDLRP